MDNSFDVFRNEVERYARLADSEWERIIKTLTRHSLEKNESLISVGETCDKLWFILNGIVRYYQLDSDNNERTTCFVPENYFCAPFSSYLNGTPSYEGIKALEAIEFLEIAKQDFLLFLDTIPAIGIMYRQMLEQAYLFMEEHNYVILNFSAKERYQKLILEAAPELLQRVPQVYLASYLGITPETLSRVRKKI